MHTKNYSYAFRRKSWSKKSLKCEFKLFDKIAIK